MKFVMMVSDFMIPAIFVLIIVIAIKKRVAVFDVFVEGAKDGLKVVLEILPTIIGLMIAVGVLRSSGFLEYLTDLIRPFTDKIGFPAPILPIAIMRMISSSASTGLVLDLFKTYGPDSFLGRMTSVMMGCTETILYTLSIYFMTINIKKTRYALSGALVVTIAGIIASVILTYYFF